MAELGDGNGSDYPGAIDSNANLEYNVTSGARTKARAQVPNDLASAILAVQTTLGVNPQGSRSTVVSYLGQEHTTTGAHNETYVVTTSGTQTITGQKTFTGGVNVGVSGMWGTATVGVSGFVRASGEGTLFPANLSLVGSVTGGTVPFNRLKSGTSAQSSVGTITISTSVTLPIISTGALAVEVGDEVLVHAICLPSKGGTAGRTALSIVVSGGTGQWVNGSSLIGDSKYVESNGQYRFNIFGIYVVTTGGAANFTLQGVSDGSDSTIIAGNAQIRGVVLKGT